MDKERIEIAHLETTDILAQNNCVIGNIINYLVKKNVTRKEHISIVQQHTNYIITRIMEVKVVLWQMVNHNEWPQCINIWVYVV